MGHYIKLHQVGLCRCERWLYKRKLPLLDESGNFTIAWGEMPPSFRVVRIVTTFKWNSTREQNAGHFSQRWNRERLKMSSLRRTVPFICPGRSVLLSLLEFLFRITPSLGSRSMMSSRNVRHQADTPPLCFNIIRFRTASSTYLQVT